MRKVIYFGPFFLVLLTLDIALKAYVARFLDYPLMIARFPWGINFSLERVLNEGAMWGIFSGYSSFLLAFRCLVAITLIVILMRFTKSKLSAFLLTILIAGAVGNIIDSFVYGHVVDMLHFTFSGYSYGVFNLADAYISIGCLGLILLGFSKKESAQKV